MSSGINSSTSSGKVTPEMRARIERMFGSDRLWALGFIVGLWLAYAFVFFAIMSVVSDPNITIAMVVSGVLVILYNTASITAMISHYREDMDGIYGIDIRHLDEMRHDRTPSHHIG